MITKTNDGIKYDMGRNTNDLERNVLSFVANAYGFLLNTPERRNKPHTWGQLADLVETHYDHRSARFFIAELRKIQEKIENGIRQVGYL